VQDFAFAYAAVGGGAALFEPDAHEVAAEGRFHVDAVARGPRAEGLDVETRVEVSGAASTLVRMADTLDADLFVVGDRGLKGLRGVLGSVPERVTHRARLDVLVVHAT
jgi:nucleotide-binding universal stress UspA family protein